MPTPVTFLLLHSSCQFPVERSGIDEVSISRALECFSQGTDLEHTLEVVSVLNGHSSSRFVDPLFLLPVEDAWVYA